MQRKKKKIKPICDFIRLKNNKLHCKCKECTKGQVKPINGLIENFSNTYDFCNGDIKKFVLLLRKGVYRSESMDSWKRFDETSLPDNKKSFYSELYPEDYYTHAQKAFEEFKLKNLGDFHNLNVQSDTLLLADVFESFRNKCIEIYELDPAHFWSAPELTWETCLELLTDIDMLLMIERGIKGGMCHSTHIYAETNNKIYEKNDKNIISLYLEYLDVNNLYGCGMSKIEEMRKTLSKFKEDFIKNFDEKI